MTSIVADAGVYAPQHDSKLLADVLGRSAVHGADVLDLCTGTGVIAIAAATLGARRVMALDISARAIECTRGNAGDADVHVDARLGSVLTAAEFGPFDIVTCNPPYVPAENQNAVGDDLRRAWDAGPDGRLVLDPLCRSAHTLLRTGGTLLIVQSEFADVPKSLFQLTASGFRAAVVSRCDISFGPVMVARASWLEASGRLEPGCRTEELVVIRAVLGVDHTALH